MDALLQSRAHRSDAIDVLRGVAIAAVVALHAAGGYVAMLDPDGVAWLIAAVACAIGAVGVPLFLSISVLGLAESPYSKWTSPRDHALFIAKRIGVLLPGYLFWGGLTLLRSGADLAQGRQVLSAFLTGSMGPQFYYVPLILQFYVLWPIVAFCMERRPAARAVLALAAVVAGMAVWQPGYGGKPWLLLPQWLPYLAPAVALGGWSVIRSRPSVIAAVGFAATVVTLAWCLQVYIPDASGADTPLGRLVGTTVFQAPQLAYAFAALMFLAGAAELCAGRALGRVMRELARHAYGVYLIHFLVLQVVVHRLLGRPDDGDAAVLDILWAYGLTLGLSYCVVRAVGSIRVLRPVVGLR